LELFINFASGSPQFDACVEGTSGGKTSDGSIASFGC